MAPKEWGAIGRSLDATAAIILAAGKSTRMNSDLPKVLHEICGRPMLSFVLGACRLAGVDRLIVVVGHGKDEVMARFSEDDDVTWVEQSQQKGTGHAVMCCRELIRGAAGTALVVAGDMPLVRRETLVELMDSRAQSGDAVTLATTMLDDPTGYGRIIRDAQGQLQAIIEHRDCTEKQREIHEVNPSYYCFDADRLFAALDGVRQQPRGGDYYLTDAVRVLREQGSAVSATVMVPAEEAMGINSRLDLVRASRAMQDRLQLGLLGDGVTIVDPDNTWIEADVSVGRDTTIHPFSFVGVGAMIGERCRIGPFAHVAPGATVADGVVINSNRCEGAS